MELRLASLHITGDGRPGVILLLFGNVYVDNLDEALKMCLTTHSLLASIGVIFILSKN
jgi:hypothetical protein